MHSRKETTSRVLKSGGGEAGTGDLWDQACERFKSGLISAARSLGAAATSLIAGVTELHGRAGKPKRLELIETLALGGRRQLFIVMCDNERYLVGAGAESVGTIVPLEPRPKPPEKAAKGPLLVRERHRDAGRITSAEPIRRKTLEAVSETGDLWQ